MTASPISDLNPIFLSSKTILTVVSKGSLISNVSETCMSYTMLHYKHPNFLDRGSRTVEMNEQFFTGYRRTVIASDEIVTSVTIPFTKEVHN